MNDMRFKRIFLLIAVLLGFTGKTLAQPTDAELAQMMQEAAFKDKWELANNLFLEMQYFQASRIYKYMLDEQPNNTNTLYHMGICLLNSATQKKEALAYLEKVPENIARAYDPFTFTESAAPVDAWFYLGKAYHINYQFDKALAAYSNFLKEASKKHVLAADATLEIQHCKNAQLLVADKRNWIIKNMGNVINSESSEYSPIMSLDGNILYFTSKRLWDDSTNMDDINPIDGKYFEDVFMSIKNREGQWSKPTILYDFCEPGRHEATISSSADGQTVYIYIDNNGDGNIYQSELFDTSFGAIKKIPGSEINTSSWETHCTLTPDGNTMYFVSDRKGGKGKRDIYRVKKLPNGQWSKAMPLAKLNTEFDEDSPFIAADGTTLYFSSNGPNSMGGFDIFMTKLVNNDGIEEWTDPVNMGYPLNTVDDDVFFIQTPNGLFGYYSSMRYVLDEDKGNEISYGEKDIYEITFEKSDLENVALLKGFINTSDGSPLPTGIEILVYNLTEGTGPDLYRPDMRTNGYVLALKPCTQYKVEYTLNHKVFYETEFDVPCNSGYQEIHKEIFLNALTLDGGENTTNATGNINKANIVRWKVVNTPKPLSGTNVMPFTEDGKPLKMVAINQNGIFEYEKIPGQREYLFEIQSPDIGMCEEICVALLDSADRIIGYAKRDKMCRFTYEMFEKKWQVMYKGKPYDAIGTKITYVDENGNISLQDEVGCSGYFKYQEIGAKGQQLFTIDADEPDLCNEMKVVLVDENGNPIGETIRDARCRFIYKRDGGETMETAKDKAYYERFYTYNKKGIANDDKVFAAFVDDVAQIIKVRGKAEVEFESSASKVPTTTYGTNDNLTKKRAADAKDRLTAALKAKGVDTSKLVIKAVNTQVLGPEYNNDYIANKETYEKYQFIKITVK